MGHTAEPWQVEDRGNMAVSIVGMTRVEDRHWTGTCHYLGSLFMRSDMDRACLCVNACGGYSKVNGEWVKTHERMADPAGFVEDARELLACIDKLGLRKLVAGWHGEGKPGGPYQPHPKNLGCKLDTTCGLVVMIDRAAEALRKHDAALSAKEVG